MRVVELLVTLTLMLTVVTCGVKGRDRAANNRRRRHRHNPYALPPTTETVVDDYDDVEVSSYCRESVAHHENYVRAMTQAPNSSSKVYRIILYVEIFEVLRYQNQGRLSDHGGL